MSAKRESGPAAKGHPLGIGEVIVPHDEESKAFVKAELERGTAVHPPTDGKLPPGATHVIVGKGEDGLPMLQRARFSAF